MMIRKLVVNDCGMQDNVLEQILLGIEEQNYLQSFNYVNGNILGPASTEVLLRIMQSDGNTLSEFNLCNVQIGDPLP